MNAIAVDPPAGEGLDEGVEKVETVGRVWYGGGSQGRYEPHHSLEALEIGLDLVQARVRH